MSDKRTNDVPEELVFPGLRGTEHDARELRRRRTAAWFATAGTFLVIVALWAMLLPTQLGKEPSFGMKNAPGWQQAKDVVGEQAPAFDASVREMQQQLDTLEAQQREAANRIAAEEEAARLRERIETSSQSADGTDGTNQPNPTTP